MLACVLVGSCKFVDGGNDAAFVHSSFKKVALSEVGHVLHAQL